MSFAFRYWWTVYKGTLRGSVKIAVVIAVFTIIATLMPTFSEPLSTVIMIKSLVVSLTTAAIICALFFAFLGGICFLVIKHKCKYYEILNEKGYGMEAFNYYQQTYIIGKPVNESDYIEFAELYQKLGDYNSAVNVLNSINVPESKENLRVMYLFVYMTIAIGKNDAALADDIWKHNANFINSIVSNPKSAANSNALYLVMIYADCIAGRYERAFQLCRNFLNGNHIKKYKTYKENFLVMKIYLLKKLGREAEVNSAVEEFNRYVANEWKPLLEVARTELRKDAAKAINGELPF